MTNTLLTAPDINKEPYAPRAKIIEEFAKLMGWKIDHSPGAISATVFEDVEYLNTTTQLVLPVIISTGAMLTVLYNYNQISWSIYLSDRVY